MLAFGIIRRDYNAFEGVPKYFKEKLEITRRVLR
jgi:hypothetical protein